MHTRDKSSAKAKNVLRDSGFHALNLDTFSSKISLLLCISERWPSSFCLNDSGLII